MNIENTIGYQDAGNMWSSFYGFIPDMMVGMNNTFYSFKNGELYEHDKGDQNVFYGEYLPSELHVIFNEWPSDDKTFNAIIQEGTEPWEVVLESNLTSSTITKDEFRERESRWFAYTRRNEKEIDFKSLATVGIGNINTVAQYGDRKRGMTFTKVNERLSIGDNVYETIDGVPALIGTVNEILGGQDIIVNSVIWEPIRTEFVYGVKNSRLEGSALRGYYMTAKLKSYATEEIELFAVNTNMDKSYV